MTDSNNNQIPANSLPTGTEYEDQPWSTGQLIHNVGAPRWLVDQVLIDGQAAVIGGPCKSLLTSVAVDLALSVASGAPFLGRFQVVSPSRVLFVTAYSRALEVRQKAEVICKSKNVDPATCAVGWHTNLPRLFQAADFHRLAEGMRRHDVRVVIFDPLFLMLPAPPEPAAESFAEIGPALDQAVSICLAAGAMPVFVHHVTKSSGRAASDYPLRLDDLTLSGVAEVTRQWLLVNRYRDYELGTGSHELNLAVGGTIGQSSYWRLSVEEGMPAPDLTGRRWEVDVSPAPTARDEDDTHHWHDDDESRRARGKGGRGPTEPRRPSDRRGRHE